MSPLQFELGTAPMTSLGIVSDLISRLHSDPLWDRSILSLLLSKNSLDLEGLVGRLWRKRLVNDNF